MPTSVGKNKRPTNGEYVGGMVISSANGKLRGPGAPKETDEQIKHAPIDTESSNVGKKSETNQPPEIKTETTPGTTEFEK